MSIIMNQSIKLQQRRAEREGGLVNPDEKPMSFKDQLSALSKQVGGQHYKDQAIQPVEYIHANKIGYFEGNVIKYVTRWRNKNGIADLEKAKHYIELLIELESKNADLAQKEGDCSSTS